MKAAQAFFPFLRLNCKAEVPCCAAGPMVQHLGLQGLNDMAVHALGYQDLNRSISPAAAANAVHEIAANNPDSVHALWKRLDKAYLRPLFGGRASGQPHLYELGTGNTDDLEVDEDDGSSPHHVLQMHSSELRHVESGLSSVDASDDAYRPPHASDAALSPSHRGLLGRASNGLPHG